MASNPPKKAAGDERMTANRDIPHRMIAMSTPPIQRSRFTSPPHPPPTRTCAPRPPPQATQMLDGREGLRASGSAHPQ